MSRPPKQICPETGYSVFNNRCKCEVCLEARRKEQQDRRNNTPGLTKRNNLRPYNLTLEQWQQMVDNQNNLCFVCEQPELGHNQHGLMALAVDHNHLTGAVRKLLCHRCNRALGLLGDDAERVQKLANYRKSFE